MAARGSDNSGASNVSLIEKVAENEVIDVDAVEVVDVDAVEVVDVDAVQVVDVVLSHKNNGAADAISRAGANCVDKRSPTCYLVVPAASGGASGLGLPQPLLKFKGALGVALYEQKMEVLHEEAQAVAPAASVAVPEGAVAAGGGATSSVATVVGAARVAEALCIGGVAGVDGASALGGLARVGAVAPAGGVSLVGGAPPAWG